MMREQQTKSTRTIQFRVNPARRAQMAAKDDDNVFRWTAWKHSLTLRAARASEQRRADETGVKPLFEFRYAPR